jgi:hypothetical protein
MAGLGDPGDVVTGGDQVPRGGPAEPAARAGEQYPHNTPDPCRTRE